MGGRCPNPNPQMGNIHRYLLQEEIQRTRLPNGQEIDSRNWFYYDPQLPIIYRF